MNEQLSGHHTNFKFFFFSASKQRGSFWVLGDLKSSVTPSEPLSKTVNVSGMSVGEGRGKTGTDVKWIS
jgi:hypothetical protein